MNRWRARRQASENDEQGDRQVDGEDGDGETRRWKMEGARVCVCVYLELQVVTSRFMGKINVHLGKLNGKANRVRAGKFKYAITRFAAAVPPSSRYFCREISSGGLPKHCGVGIFLAERFFLGSANQISRRIVKLNRKDVLWESD